MEPNKFIAEVYRRKDKLNPAYDNPIDPGLFLNNKSVEIAVKQYKKVLPQNRNKKILDIGCEMGCATDVIVDFGEKTHDDIVDWGEKTHDDITTAIDEAKIYFKNRYK